MHLKHEKRHRKHEAAPTPVTKLGHGLSAVEQKTCAAKNLTLILSMVFGILLVLLIFIVIMYQCYRRYKRVDHETLMKEVETSPKDVEWSTGLVIEQKREQQRKHRVFKPLTQSIVTLQKDTHNQVKKFQLIPEESSEYDTTSSDEN